MNSRSLTNLVASLSRGKFWYWLPACIVAAGLNGFYVYTVQTDASLNLFAAQTATNALLHYMTEYERWPESLAELKKVNVEQLYFEWPADAEEVFRRVTIQYNVPLMEVAESDPESFQFVICQGPVFRNSFQAKVEMLILRAREILEESRRIGSALPNHDDLPAIPFATDN